MKKSIALVLMIAFAITLGGCGSKPQTDKIRMWIYAGSEEAWGGKPGEVLAMQEFTKTTGLQLEYLYPHGDMGDEFNLLMTGDNKPDLVWNAWSSKKLLDLAKTKKIVNIAPLLEKHMPNFYALLQSDKRLKAQMYSEDGKLFYLPWIAKDKIFFEGMALRKDWLEATGMPIPRTNTELYNVLAKMKQLAASGKLPDCKDFIGLTGGTWGTCKWLYGFGATDDFMLADDGQTVQYGPVTDNYRQGLIWFNKLYKEKLLDPDFFASSADVSKKHVLNNQAVGNVDNWGVFSTYIMDSEKLGKKIDFVAIPYPIYNNEALPREYNSTTKRVAQPYGFALTTQDEARLIKILEGMDWMYGPDGLQLFNWGIEGKTFVKNSDGSKSYTDLIMKDPKYPPAVAYSKYCKPDMTMQDGAVEFALNNAEGRAVEAVWAKTNAKYSWEPFMWYTTDEYNAIGTKSTDIGTYKNEMRDKFLSGKLDPNNDSDWKTYTDTIKKLGLDDWLKIQQTVYTRFIKRVQ